MAILTAKTKIQMSKTKCESLDDKPTEETELIELSCSSKGLSINVGEDTTVDTTTICDEDPQSMTAMSGESTASMTLFYNSKADSGYTSIREAHESKEKRYFCITFTDGGKEEFIANVTAHDITVDVKDLVNANASLKISGKVKKTDAI